MLKVCHVVALETTVPPSGSVRSALWRRLLSPCRLRRFVVFVAEGYFGLNRAANLFQYEAILVVFDDTFILVVWFRASYFVKSY